MNPSFGAEVKIFDPTGLPMFDHTSRDHPKVQELMDMAIWSEAMVWCSPEVHGNMIDLKSAINWKYSAPIISKEMEAGIIRDCIKTDTMVIQLGIVIKLPKYFRMNLPARSSTWFKYGLITGNGFGVIDGDCNLSNCIKGLEFGKPIFIRIFKQEAQLEIWVKSNDDTQKVVAVGKRFAYQLWLDNNKWYFGILNHWQKQNRCLRCGYQCTH